MTGVQTCALPISYELKWNTTSYDDGSAHSITVRAYDKSENVTDSDPVAVIVDNTLSYPSPVNISSIAYTVEEMTIIWEKSNAEDFSNYDLLYADSEQGVKETLVTKNNINDTTYTLTDFDPSHKSWYWVSVTDSLEYSSIGSSYVVLDSIQMQIEINKITYNNNAFLIQWSQSVDEDFSKYLDVMEIREHNFKTKKYCKTCLDNLNNKYKEIKNHNNKWLEWEDHLLKIVYMNKKIKEILELYPHRTWEGIMHRAQRLGLSNGKRKTYHFSTKKMTDIEKKIAKFLNKQGIDYKFNEVINNNGKIVVPDFKIDNIIIECDGDYWHKGRKKEDDKRQKYLESLGFIVLRFKGSQINKNFDEVKKCILQKLNL